MYVICDSVRRELKGKKIRERTKCTDFWAQYLPIGGFINGESLPDGMFNNLTLFYKFTEHCVDHTFTVKVLPGRKLVQKSAHFM